MKSVFYAGAGIQSVLFFLNDGYLSATLACGSGVSPRTVRWGGTLLPQAIGRAMEWPDSRPKRKLPTHRLDRLAGCRHSERIFWMPAPARENTLIIKTPFMIFITRRKVVSPVFRGK